MADNNQNKAELYRQERKERLAKAAKKNAKNIEKKTAVRSAVKKVIAIILVAVIALGCLTGILNYCGIIQRAVQIGYVGNEKLSYSEYTYYYYKVYNQVVQTAGQYSQYGMDYGYDTSLTPAEQTKTTKDEDGNEITWLESIHNQTLDVAQMYLAYYQEAKKKGLTLDESDLASVNSAIEDMRKQADSEGKSGEDDTNVGLSLNAYLRRVYGNGISEGFYKKQLKLETLVQKYYNTINNQGKDNFIDELFYAANWMYMATGDEEYLDKCKNEYIPLFPLESQSTEHKFTWGFCWDDTTQGGALLYAINTGDKEWVDHIKHHLDYWINGYGGKQVEQTPDGLSHLNSWGSLRYAEGTAWLAKVACDTIFKDDAALCEKYNNWAKSQMDYAFGDNDLGLSYVVGMGKNPVNIHHRGASGIHDDHWNELGTKDTSGGKWQTEYAHVLYGALEGGPNRDGSFKDDNGSYENTEVAIDYNAGYTACLCAMIEDYGGEILADFPKAETPKWDEWLVSAKINGEGNSYTEIKAWAMNHTAWPARVAKDVEYRYYFDVSELIDAGLSVDQIIVASNNQQYGKGEQGYATVSGPYKYEGDASGNTYYASVKFEDGRAIMPTGQSEHRDEVQFRVSIPDAIDGKSTAGAWDPKNDWSYDGLTSKTDDLTLPDALAKHIPMYVNGVLVWGEEPDGTVPTKSDYVPKRSAQGGPGTEDPTKETETESKEDPTKDDPTDSTGLKPTLLGDANLDKQVNVADAVLVMQVATNPDKYGRGKTDLSIKEQGEANADVDGKKGLSNNDALLIQKFKLGLIDKFPVES